MVIRIIETTFDRDTAGIHCDSSPLDPGLDISVDWIYRRSIGLLKVIIRLSLSYINR